MGVSLALPHHHFFTTSSIKNPPSSPSQFPPFPPPRPVKPPHINLKTAIPRHVRQTIAKAIEEGQDQQNLNASTDSDDNTESSRDKTLETLGGGGGGGGVSVSPNGWWGGVAEEIGEIEWPAFGRVVGTTGVVLAVIAGSSVVLLTVNAVLAELSDRVFNGRGVQDFFA
ncbi:hypothetical protein Scep_023100 [Stephania cephalantha]|uniref:Preprotein translocase subunit SECE1 n=1 Tax=Stephania cephalantha TaxID=152367 RepID=A0AAP0EU46_9MAGN